MNGRVDKELGLGYTRSVQQIDYETFVSSSIPLTSQKTAVIF
jgi:hypothetical protein